MAFGDVTQYKAAFKLLFGKAHTSNSKDLVNEAKPANVLLGANQVFGESISSTPSQAVTDGVAEFVTCTLTVDSTSNGLSYQATYPVGHPLVGQNVSNIIPQSYGDGYRAILKNNGTEVPPLAANNWFLINSSGIVTSETALSLTNGTLECYRYIGQMVLDRLNTATVAANTEIKTLTSTDVSNGYVDLAYVASEDTVGVTVMGISQTYTIDFTVSLTGGVGGKTRVTFSGDLIPPRESALVAGDVVEFTYIIANV